jgi:hypothetical protein
MAILTLQLAQVLPQPHGGWKLVEQHEGNWRGSRSPSPYVLMVPSTWRTFMAKAVLAQRAVKRAVILILMVESVMRKFGDV